VDYSPGVVQSVAFLFVGVDDTVKIIAFAHQFVGDFVFEMIFHKITF
jgi:hypothetical protein